MSDADKAAQFVADLKELAGAVGVYYRKHKKRPGFDELRFFAHVLSRDYHGFRLAIPRRVLQQFEAKRKPFERQTIFNTNDRGNRDE